MNAPDLCALTVQDVHASNWYRFIDAVQQSVINAEVDSACAALRRSSTRRYDAFVNDLRFWFFLTAAQARELKALASGL